MLMYFLYYCAIGIVFWLFSFARWPLTWKPVAEAWSDGVLATVVLCVALLLFWPYFAVQKKS